ncbi:MAG: hypothetical protein FJX74_08370 [Armatimonadetes bacterium]|nr:hypothetical protein [Armatimonadota bacterium]
MLRRRRLSLLALCVALYGASGCRHGAVGADGQEADAPWLGNALGVTDGVASPWTALEVSDNTVVYWGGRIDLGGSGLPRRITSQGLDLLSRPVAFDIRANGAAPAFTDSELRPEEVTDAAVTLVGSSAAPGLTLDCRTRVEFDGMMRLDVKVTAREATRLDGLTLEVPLRAEAAELFRRFYIYDFDTMQVDREDLARAGGSTAAGWSIPFTPYVWIGVPEAGLEWFCESDQAWRPWGIPDALTLTHAADEVMLAARMITQPLPLRAGETWEATFGLSPTPSRPRIADWRSYRWGGRLDGPPVEVDSATHKVFAVFWIGEPGGLALACPGMPWPADPTAYAAARADLAKDNILYIPYGSLFKIDTSIPEWQRFGEEWSGGRKLGGWTARDRTTAQTSSVDVAAPSYRDFIVHTYSEMIRQHDIDGLYFDFGAPGLNPINPGRPEGRLAEQGIYYTPLFALRELYKRLYVAGETQKPGFLTIIHGMLPAMCASFVDANVQGEGLQGRFNTSGLEAGPAERLMADKRWYEADYIGALPLEWYVAELARDVAEFPVLIPQITKQNRTYYRDHPDEVTAYTRNLLAVAALCDIHAIWLTNADNGTLRAYSQAKAKFAPLGDDCAFHPFWRSPVRLEPQAPGLYATLYTRPDRALLILSNLSDAPAAVTAALGLDGLGVTPAAGAASDAMTGASVPLSPEGSVSITVPAKDFAVVLVN